jgi:hypothetical protein
MNRPTLLKIDTVGWGSAEHLRHLDTMLDYYISVLKEIASYEKPSLEVENTFAASICGKARVALNPTASNRSAKDG